MATRKPGNPRGRGSKGSRPANPKPKRPKPKGRIRVSGVHFGSNRSAGTVYVLKLRRLLPLNDSSIAILYRWANEACRRSKRKLGFGSALLRTLGPLYEAKVIEESDSWQEQWVNGSTVPKAKDWGKAIIDRLLFKLEELELLNEGRAIWTKTFKLQLFNVFEPKQSIPHSPNL